MTRCNENKERPNILWLDAEDMCPDLGCYGLDLVQTPNLDQLAGEGALFTNAFVTSPVCSPSRSSIMTGMYQTTIGAHNHRCNRDKPLPENISVVTQYLRSAGYFTCSCQALDWDKKGKMDYNFKLSFFEAFDGTDWRQRRPDQPFFAQVHFWEVHRPFQSDPENPIDPDDVELPPYYPDHPVSRLDWALYLETIQILDKKVGKVLQRLEDDGLADNTIVFFFSDHGRPMVRGKQWLYDGGIHIPLIVRWPEHIRPGTVSDLVSTIDFAPTWLKLAGISPPEHLQGKVFLEPEAEARNQVFAARDRCGEADDRIRCVRTKRFKYIRNFFPETPYTQFNAYKKLQYPVLTLMEILYAQGKLTPEQARFMAPIRPEEELYDLQNDPYEICNLAEDPKYEMKLKELRSRLGNWIKETHDQGETPENPEVAHSLDRLKYKWFCEEMRARGLEPNITAEKYLTWWEKRLKQLKYSQCNAKIYKINSLT